MSGRNKMPGFGGALSEQQLSVRDGGVRCHAARAAFSMDTVAPIVDPTKQRRPTFSGEQVTKITNTATGRMQMAAALFAATGLRAGELLGLECRHFDGSAIHVEQEVWAGRVQEAKTANARRIVDLDPDVSTLLKQYLGSRTQGFIFQTRTGRPLSSTNLLKRELHPLLATLGISKRGFHAFRRFRNTYLRNSHCPDGLLKFWMGHAGRDMSDRYDRVREDREFRREVARSIGLGFEVPKLGGRRIGRLSGVGTADA